MEGWLYLLLLVVVPALIASIVEIIKESIDNRNKSIDLLNINKKMQNGDKLDAIDKIIISDQIKKYNLQKDIYKRREGK